VVVICAFCSRGMTCSINNVLLVNQFRLQRHVEARALVKCKCPHISIDAEVPLEALV
jgi:hypothetical protein